MYWNESKSANIANTFLQTLFMPSKLSHILFFVCSASSHNNDDSVIIVNKLNVCVDFIT